MNRNTCSFFGHRNTILDNNKYQLLIKIIKDLIINKGVTVFLFGSHSRFNDICYKIVSKLKEKHPQIKRIAYTCKNESCVLESDIQNHPNIFSFIESQNIDLFIVDEEFDYKTKYTSGKASYIERNQAMIDNSYYCIFYYNKEYKPKEIKHSKHCVNYYQPKSGTQVAYTYAIRRKKQIINIVDL